MIFDGMFKANEIFLVTSIINLLNLEIQNDVEDNDYD